MIDKTILFLHAYTYIYSLLVYSKNASYNYVSVINNLQPF